MIGERVGWAEPGPARWLAEAAVGGAVGAAAVLGSEVMQGGDIDPSRALMGGVAAAGLVLSARALVETCRDFRDNRFTRDYLEQELTRQANLDSH